MKLENGHWYPLILCLPSTPQWPGMGKHGQTQRPGRQSSSLVSGTHPQDPISLDLFLICSMGGREE